MQLSSESTIVFIIISFEIESALYINIMYVYLHEFCLLFNQIHCIKKKYDAFILRRRHGDSRLARRQAGSIEAMSVGFIPVILHQLHLFAH